MVFESFLTPASAEQKPWLTFFLGFVCSSIAVFLSNFIFPNNSSLTIVFLTTLFFIPLFYLTMIHEEQKDLTDKDEKTLLKEHSLALSFFIFLFLGMTLSFMLWYLLFSSTSFFNIDAHTIFKVQDETISSINAKATSGLAISIKHLGVILENNIKVMVFCILFSFIYGAGALFIITWNSTVIGLALGKYALAIVGLAAGNATLVYAKATGCAFTRYLIHGIPEILAYFIAGLAGGIISVALIKHDFGTDKFEKIMLDASLLILIGVGVVLLSGIIEVFITPLLTCRVA